MGNAEEFDGQMLFTRLSSFIKPKRQGVLEEYEFRMAAKAPGMGGQEADRAFACLDHGMHAPPATIDATDMAWLKRLPSLVDTEAVSCATDVKFDLGLAPHLVLGSPMPDQSSPLSGAMQAWESPGRQGL